MQKFHIALGIKNINKAIIDFTYKLDSKPIIIIKNKYVLFRTETLNISLRKDNQVSLRHLGWEDSTCKSFEKTVDSNRILWERFPFEYQLKEIRDIFPLN